VQFLRSVLGQFGLTPDSRTAMDLTTEFLRYLEAMHVARRKVLLIIDEGQNCSSSQLEILRTFLSFETPTDKLINVVIFAQPELEEKIVRKRNLAQRVGMDHKLNPLNRRDTAGLIQFRLKMARFCVLNASNKCASLADDEDIFTEDAIDVIHERSHGIPRAITNFCSDALIEAAFLRRKTIDAALVNEVIGRRIFTGADEDGRAVRQVQTTLAIPGGAAGGVVSMDEARERRRA
jgi:general secretion pathway protein A